MKNFFKEAIITIAIALVIFLVARETIQTYEVFMTSMEPNFHEGQRVVVNKAAYWGWVGEPERGDVIIFKAPNGSREDFIKRVIGVPGDTVEVKNGGVYVNGTRLEEPYIPPGNTPVYTMQPTQIPDGRYFVLGDNRNHSNDSHNGWLVEIENIRGKAWLSTWPPDSWGLVTDYPLEEQLVKADS